jgi:hypothetical protein
MALKTTALYDAGAVAQNSFSTHPAYAEKPCPPFHVPHAWDWRPQYVLPFSPELLWRVQQPTGLSAETGEPAAVRLHLSTTGFGGTFRRLRSLGLRVQRFRGAGPE